jgi:hypothetical protein
VSADIAAKPVAWALVNLASNRIVDVSTSDNAEFRLREKWGHSDLERVVPLFIRAATETPESLALLDACIEEAEAFEAWSNCGIGNPESVPAFRKYHAAKKTREAAVRTLRASKVQP